MKRLLLLFVTLTGVFGAAAQTETPMPDSASIVVERYNTLLNHGTITNDSMLYIESMVMDAYHPSDTLFMRRWFVMPNFHRVEIVFRDSLIFAIYGDGFMHYRQYDTAGRIWRNIKPDEFWDQMSGYDFHGPLYDWKKRGLELSYRGLWNFRGTPVMRVYVEDPDRFPRNYLFEKKSGLLFYIDELDSAAVKPPPNAKTQHVHWRAYSEYIPLGKQLFISAESYMQDNQVTVTLHRYRMTTRDMALFYVDHYKP